MRRERKKILRMMLVIVLVSLDLIGISYACWGEQKIMDTSFSTGNMNVYYDQQIDCINFDSKSEKCFCGIVGYIHNDSTFPVSIVGNPEQTFLSIFGKKTIIATYPEEIGVGEKGAVKIRFEVPLLSKVVDNRVESDKLVKTLDANFDAESAQSNELYNIDKKISFISDWIKLYNPTYVQSNLKGLGD